MPLLDYAPYSEWGTSIEPKGVKPFGVKMRPPQTFTDPRFWTGLIRKGGAGIGRLNTPIGPFNISAQFGMDRKMQPRGAYFEPATPLLRHGVYGGLGLTRRW